MAVDINFHTDISGQEESLRKIVKQKVKKLADRYQAITDVTINVTQEYPANTPHLIKAQVVLHTRPKDILANKTGSEAETVLRETFDAVERQTRKFFDKLQKPWEKPDEKISASGEET